MPEIYFMIRWWDGLMSCVSGEREVLTYWFVPVADAEPSGSSETCFAKRERIHNNVAEMILRDGDADHWKNDEESICSDLWFVSRCKNVLFLLHYDCWLIAFFMIIGWSSLNFIHSFLEKPLIHHIKRNSWSSYVVMFISHPLLLFYVSFVIQIQGRKVVFWETDEE